MKSNLGSFLTKSEETNQLQINALKLVRTLIEKKACQHIISNHGRFRCYDDIMSSCVTGEENKYSKQEVMGLTPAHSCPLFFVTFDSADSSDLLTT